VDGLAACELIAAIHPLVSASHHTRVLLSEITGPPVLVVGDGLIWRG